MPTHAGSNALHLCARGMGLYDDLPSAVTTTRARGSADDASSGDSGGDGGGEVGGDARTHKRVKLDDGGAEENRAEATKATTVTTNDALRRIATHMLKPEKFAKASGILKRLMLHEEDGLSRAHASALFSCLENAMTPSCRRALAVETRVEYEELFEVVAAFAPVVFNSKQRRKVEVFGLYARRINALFGDDSFSFNKAVKFIEEKVETCEAYVETDDVHEADIDVPPAPEGMSEEEAKEMAEAFLRAQHAERNAEIEQRQIEEDIRVALVVALETCASLYSRPWSQTTIDMMANFFHERRGKFSEACKDDIVRIWDELRKKKNARQGQGQSARGVGMTSFERDAARLAGTAVSARGAVGGERLKDGRGESAANLFG